MNKTKAIMVVFGGTGDLTYRKLLPAISNLSEEGRLPEKFIIVAVARKSFTKESYSVEIEKNSKSIYPFKHKTEYFQLSFDDQDGYKRLNFFLNQLDEQYGTKGNRLFYFATAPSYFEVISNNLKEAGMIHQNDSWQRIMIEKPFGYDLNSARQLNEVLCQTVSEQNIYRIDHYLGKEMLQNIIYIRFSNMIFDRVWDKDSIDNIQITVSEDIGIEGRGAYYDQSGALRDMVQNHLFQMLALLTMKRPARFDPESIRDEKVRMLKLLKPLNEDNLKDAVVFGQYESVGDFNSYVDEEGVSPVSTTETFVGLKLFIDDPRWTGVPFYLKTGKRLDKKQAYISVEFKETTHGESFFGGEHKPNILGIRIQPFEGIYLKFNIKEPGHLNHMVPADTDYCHNCDINYRSPEAYERLLLDALNGDASLFTRWDEVEASWTFIDQLTSLCCLEKRSLLTPYLSGGKGPESFDKLIERDKKVWWTF